jgi:hypothetical protein
MLIDYKVVITVLLLGAQACDRAPQPPASVLADARQELESRGQTDQAVREGFGTNDKFDYTAMARTDSENTVWLKAYVARWGWPTVTQVGHEAVVAAFLIVQHAVHDTAFMRAMLPAIEDSQRRGDLDGGAVALLTDRLEVKAGRPQVYGTQLSFRNGHLVLDPIIDSARVDERRQRMGLPPLAEYLRLVDSVMRAR